MKDNSEGQEQFPSLCFSAWGMLLGGEQIALCSTRHFVTPMYQCILTKALLFVSASGEKAAKQINTKSQAPAV